MVFGLIFLGFLDNCRLSRTDLTSITSDKKPVKEHRKNLAV